MYLRRTIHPLRTMRPARTIHLLRTIYLLTMYMLPIGMNSNNQLLTPVLTSKFVKPITETLQKPAKRLKGGQLRSEVIHKEEGGMYMVS